MTTILFTFIVSAVVALILGFLLGFFKKVFHHMEPAQARRLFRDNSMVRPTAGMCAGYAQCNLIVLPSREAADFRKFARRNPIQYCALSILLSKSVHVAADGKMPLLFTTE